MNYLKYIFFVQNGAFIVIIINNYFKYTVILNPHPKSIFQQHLKKIYY